MPEVLCLPRINSMDELEQYKDMIVYAADSKPVRHSLAVWNRTTTNGFLTTVTTPERSLSALHTQLITKECC